MAATMKDIARETGLGLATISSYFNGGNVREKNRIKIEAAIKELHYEVNEVARGLKTNATKTIGVVIPELNNVFCSEIITEMEDILRNHGYATIVCDCRTDEKLEKEAVDFLMRKRVDGLINMPVDITGSHLREFQETGKPIVLIDRSIRGMECDAVLTDNQRAGMEAVELLIENGHTNIGIIIGPREISTSQERFGGYCMAHQRAGISVRESLIYHGDYTISGGVKGLEALVRRNPDMTAVFVTNYEMTMGAMIGINELGISVPEELSIIGFDNLSFARACSPKLFIVSQPTQKIARAVAKQILSRLEGTREEKEGEKRIEKFRTEMITGKSVKNITRCSDNGQEEGAAGLAETERTAFTEVTMKKEYLLGIDIGTSACKVAVFEKDGTVAAQATGSYPVYYPKEGWAEQNPEEWWMAVCCAIREVLKKGEISPEEIKGVGIDGQSWSAIAIDAQGKVLTNTPIWMDTRAQSICDRLNTEIGGEKIFQVSGNSLQPSYTTAKILWYKENLPEVYQKIDKILQSNSYIAFRLTGAITQEPSQGYGLHCFDMHRGMWDEDMCEKLGIPRSFLPEIVPCDQVVGTVTEKAAEECGLQVGTPVVAGGLDAACGTLGAGVIHPGETQEQGGQAGGMSICMDRYQADPRLILGFHVVPGKWLLQGGTTGGGGVMRWFEREFADYERSIAEKKGESSLVQLNEIAEDIPAGSEGVLFLPYMAGERSPIWNPDAKGVFYGLDFSKTKGHMVRACMEGVAFSLRHNLEVAREGGAKADVLRAMGGAANSLLWTQIKADVTGKTIIVPSSDTATTLGAAILAGIGVGMYQSYEEAVALTVKETRKHQADPRTKEIYDQAFGKYKELYGALEPLMK